MVYIKHWSEFHAQALDLYSKNPDRTRYLVKTHPSRQWLVLKVTDDARTLKYRSRSTIILNRFDSFSREIHSLMAGSQASSVAAISSSAAAASSTSANGTLEGPSAATKAEAASPLATAGHPEATGATATKGSTQSNTASGPAGGGGGGGGQSKKKKKKGGKK